MSELYLTLQDAMGRQTGVKIELVSNDPATAAAAAILVADHVAEMSQLELVKARLSLPVSFNPNTAEATSNTDVGGKVKGTSDDDGKTVNLRIPDPIAAIVRADATLDLAQINLAAYLAHFATGGECSLSDGEQVAAWRYGTLDKR